jgi:hypothetical protein
MASIVVPANAPSPQRLASALSERRLPLIVTAAVTAGCLAVLALLLSIGHTTGGEIDGPTVAGLGLLTGVLSLGFLAVPGRHRIALGVLVVLWISVALGGIGGYADHAIAVTSASADQRARLPLAPLIFTVFGIAGAATLIVGGRRHQS